MRDKNSGASKKIPQATTLAPITDEALYLMDIPTCARRLSTTVFAVRALIRSNKLKFISVGHKMLISPAAIQNFIKSSENYYRDDLSSSDRVDG